MRGNGHETGGEEIRDTDLEQTTAAVKGRVDAIGGGKLLEVES